MRLLSELEEADVSTFTDAELQAYAGQAADQLGDDRKHSQLLYYTPNNDQALKFHLATEPIVGLSGGNRCLPLEAPVLMADGTWRSLGDIEVGDIVMATDERGVHGRPARVRQVFRSGLQEVLRFHCSDGTAFSCTADHQVPLYLGSGRRTTKGHPKAPRKRRIGDYLTRIGTKNVAKRLAVIQPADMQYRVPDAHALLFDQWTCYFLGFYLGDGCFSDTVKLSCGNTKVIERLRVVASLHACKLVEYGRYDYGVCGLERKDGYLYNPLRLMLMDLGLKKKDSYHKFIPSCVFGLPRSHRLKILEGLIDADGSRHEFTTCSDQLRDDFVRLIHSLGGKATSATRTTQDQHGTACRSHRVYWRINDQLDLCCDYKQSAGKRAVDYQRKVLRSVESLGMMACGDIEVDHEGHCYVTEGYTIVSNSGKSDTSLADLVIQATGIIPDALRDVYPREKIRGPISCRIVLESITTTMDQVIMRKLKWNQWNGLPPQGGPRGHWGWIPRWCLLDGDWDKSYTAIKRELTFKCVNPDDWDEVIGESTIQFMSFDQKPEKFASGEFHVVMLDEPPSYAIYRECVTRTMSVNGRVTLSMTWPDDPSIPVDWIFDEIYEKGVEGPRKSPHVQWIELSTLHNPNIDQQSVERQAGDMTAQERTARIEGKPIRFSNLIHPLFTDTDDYWCPRCQAVVTPGPDQQCRTCKHEVIVFNHCVSQELTHPWPVVYLLDPHPRKPHMMQWVAVDGNDDYFVLQCLEVTGGVAAVVERVKALEQDRRYEVALRLMDPNMGMSPGEAAKNPDRTWQDEFAEEGLACDLACDGSMGRDRLNDYLKPDSLTKRPRIRWHAERCAPAIFQHKRFSWDDYRRQDEKDQKQLPKRKYDDYPALSRYLMNALPTHQALRYGHQVLHLTKGMRNGY